MFDKVNMAITLEERERERAERLSSTAVWLGGLNVGTARGKNCMHGGGRP